MAELKRQYTDIRGRTHTVEHFVMPAEDGSAGERIVEELYCTLTQAGRRRAEHGDHSVCPEIR